jgi:hypothetical protein
MAATQLTAQQITVAGLSPTFEACNVDGNYFLNDTGRYFIRVKNTDSADKVVHIASPNACSQGYTHPVDVTIPAGQTIDIGEFEVSRFNDSNNYVQLTYTSGVTGLTIALLKT